MKSVADDYKQCVTLKCKGLNRECSLGVLSFASFIITILFRQIKLTEVKSFFQAEACVLLFTADMFLGLGYSLLETEKNENADTVQSVVMRIRLKNK